MFPFQINKSTLNFIMRVLFSLLIVIIGRKKELLPLLNLNLIPISQKEHIR